ncbi:hypothetical protein C8R44DRAFT_989641 [Mycena epipterygia]|nr:hypothetical protein C8R44DRAFT_989641 [Mycena epipterygia]
MPDQTSARPLQDVGGAQVAVPVAPTAFGDFLLLLPRAHRGVLFVRVILALPSFWPPLAPLALPFLGHTNNPSRIPLAIPRPRIHPIAPSPFCFPSTSPRLPPPFLPPNAAARWRTLAIITPPSSGQPPAALPGLMRALCSFYRPSPTPLPHVVGLPRMLRLYSVPQRAIHPTCIPQHRRLTWPFAGPVHLLRPARRLTMWPAGTLRTRL